MLKLVVNNITCFVYSKFELDAHGINLEADPQYMKAILMDDFYVRVSGDVSQNMLTVAGHDHTKVDGAVPQDWWNEWYKAHNNTPPWAGWSYEDPHGAFGRPLFWSDVRIEAAHAITKAFRVWIADQVSKQHLKEETNA